MKSPTIADREREAAKRRANETEEERRANYRRLLIETGALCCEQGEILQCVCISAYRCPVHGEHHYGSHE